MTLVLTGVPPTSAAVLAAAINAELAPILASLASLTAAVAALDARIAAIEANYVKTD